MDIINLVAYLLCVLLIAYLIFDGIRLRIRHRRVVSDAMQLAVDKIALIQKVQELASKQDASSVEQTDGFLKFISESRDWAFDYIEKVQEAIQDLKAAVDSGDDYEQAYVNLISMLPETLEPRSEDEIF